MKTSTHIIERRKRHLAALFALANHINPNNKLSGLQLWRKLRRLECMANAAATAQCNGEAFGGQPYRTEEQWEAFRKLVRTKIAAIFGGRVPRAFFVNSDPRGYALKLGPLSGGSNKGRLNMTK